MHAVAKAISSTIMATAFLRPTRSAYTPNTIPPMGRKMNAMPSVAVPSNSELVLKPIGKSSRAITRTNKPKTMKSNHSKALPMVEATMTRCRKARDGAVELEEGGVFIAGIGFSGGNYNNAALPTACSAPEALPSLAPAPAYQPGNRGARF